MPSSTTRDRILDAALRAMAAHGLAKLSLEDVAREAGMSRQTVYRYFGSKEALVTAAILREEHDLLAQMAAAVEAHADVRPAMEAAIVAGLRAAREHPLLDRLLATEPEALLPFLTTGGGPVLSAARPAIEALITARLPHLAETVVRRVADTATRLFISYAINPPDDDVEEVAADLVDLILHGLKAD
ncbi:MAG TPA: TetR family transcriptional regulator [Egibacteraceae bacterium]|nr:TetR family transcriptional regulator [Egibacteraceae bacterium]